MPARKWKDQDKIQKSKIIEALRESYPDPLSITQIAEKTGVFRHTTSKYIAELVKEKKITKIEIGRWDVFRINKK